MKTIIIFLSLILFKHSEAQNKNSIWCFGDSALINFSDTSNIITGRSAIKSRGSCVSIADAFGNILFSAHTRATIVGNTAQVFNSLNTIMPNGNNVLGQGWYNELLILSDPSNNYEYYLFSIGVTNSSANGLFYSKVDMTLNAGLGNVTQKNIQLLPYKASDCLTAIKHGNGRDWWVIFKTNNISNNNFYIFLVTPFGISNHNTQSIGTLTITNTVRLSTNKEGNQLILVTYNGLIEKFDFDRCTGILSNHILYFNPDPLADYLAIWSAVLSPNSRYLYFSTSGDTTYLIQLDLQDSIPWQTRDTLWIESSLQYGGGALKLAPDGKIYFTTAWNDAGNWNYPYPDSVYNTINNNLGVIHYPDSAGVACGFAPYSFNLGLGRTYWGLPNNPDYELGPIAGSVCDTLPTSIAQQITDKAAMFTYYHTGWQTAFINAKKLSGKNYVLNIYDVTGKKVYKENGMLTSSYFTKDLSCSSFSNGLYVVNFETDKERLSVKFAKE